MRHVKVRWKGVVLQWKEIKMAFQLAACAEMLWQDKPIHWRAGPAWDLDALENTGANFTIMNGYLVGRLADDEGADMLLQSARETAQIGKRLGVDRLNLQGARYTASHL